MGIKEFFTGLTGEGRQQKLFDKMVSKLVSRNYQHEDRLWAIEQLAQANSPEATSALFRRWDMVADKKREDVAEKERLSELLVAKGPSVLPFVQEHNNRSINITWPIKVLKQVVGDTEVVTELLRVLAREQARLASFKPEKKLRLIQLLADYVEDERIAAAMLPILDDFDADVRFEAVNLLGKIGDESTCGPLIERLCSEEEDSLRVQQAIVEAVHARSWKVLDRKDAITEHLGDKYRIGPKGTLIVAD